MFESVLFAYVSIRDAFIIANFFEVWIFFVKILNETVKIYFKIKSFEAGGADVADVNEDVSVIF